jgi:hypothetical protein
MEVAQKVAQPKIVTKLGSLIPHCPEIGFCVSRPALHFGSQVSSLQAI